MDKYKRYAIVSVLVKHNDSNEYSAITLSDFCKDLSIEDIEEDVKIQLKELSKEFNCEYIISGISIQKLNSSEEIDYCKINN